MKTYQRVLNCAGLALVLAACGDLLEIDPKESLAGESLENAPGVNGLLVGVYSMLTWTDLGEYDGFGISRTQTATNPSDDSGNPGTFNSHDSRTGTWRYLYRAVQRSNDVLRVLERTVEKGAISAEEARQIEAEAKFLRGYFHLELALTWENVPYIDESVAYEHDNFKVSNASGAPWSQIEGDFKFAADNLTPTKPQVGRANSWAAKAFLAKTYMFQLKFAEGKPLLESIISDGRTVNGLPYDLNPRYSANFNTVDKHGPEVVFAMQNATHTGGHHGNPGDMYNGPYNSPASACCGWAQPAEDLVNAHRVGEDGLPLLFGAYRDHPIKSDQLIPSAEAFEPDAGFIDPRLDWSVGRRGIPYLDWGVHPGQNWVRFWTSWGPYSAKKNVASQARVDIERQNVQTSNAYNFIRFADVLLWAAEVEVEIGSLAQAEAYVNRVRQRAANPDAWVKKYVDASNPLGGFSDDPAANYKVGLYNGHFSGNGQAYAREAVRMERRIELALEHHRYFDLFRYDKLQPGHMGETLNDHLEYRTDLGNLPGLIYSAGYQFRIGTNERRPIPQVEIDLSIGPDGAPTLVQNPGY